MSDPRNPRSHKDTDRGRIAERKVATKFNLDKCPDNEWCDLINPRTGTKHEVKAALIDRRFRIWKDNHMSLTASDGQGTAWYDFVVLSSGGRVQEHRRMSPSTVTKLIRDRGGWNKSGHARGSKQHKLPVSDVF